jgi:hypothetical protein
MLRKAFCAAIALGASSAYGGIINGGFEAGILGWETFGDVSIQSATLGTAPTQGNSQAFLTTLCDSQVTSGCQTDAREVPYSQISAVPNPSLPIGTLKPLEEFLGVNLFTDVFPHYQNAQPIDQPGFEGYYAGSAS